MLTQADARLVLERAQRDPVWWVKNVLGEEPWEKQAEILEAVRDYRKTAVAAAHGVGKSWAAARVALWMLFSFPQSIVVTTAPTHRQVKYVLWQEIRQAHARARYPLGGHVLQTELSLADGWFAFGFATTLPERFQGLHAEHLLVVVDEAPGVEQEIWHAIDGILTSSHSRLLAIGNPTSPSGEFYELFRSPGVAKLHISAFDTPNVKAGRVVIPGLVTREWVEDKRSRWGEDSPLWKSRVLGEFPDLGDDRLIPLSAIEAAQRRQIEPSSPVILGVDVARYGSDETVIFLRRGNVARLYAVLTGQDTMQVAGRVAQALAETGAEEARVDADGLGAGVADRLKELGKPVVAMHGGGKPINPERFLNARAEWYWNLRERIGELDLDDDELLLAQLSSLRYEFTSRGQIKLESKEDLRRRGLPSPDRADALALAIAPSVPRITPRIRAL